MTQKQEHTHHVTPIKYYFMTYAALTVLMLMTLLVVPFPFPWSWANNAVNLTIAVIKASLVVAIFMGVKWSTHLTKMFALAGFVWLTLMSITFGDYMTRGWEPVQGWNQTDRHQGKGDMAETELESVARARIAKLYPPKVEPGAATPKE
jgi:caa(3)-type oxidase subunit IV